MQNNSFKFQSSSHDHFGSSSGSGSMNNDLFAHSGSVACVPQAEDVPLHSGPVCVSATTESSPVFTQLLSKQPIASLSLGENIIHVLPGDTQTEGAQEGPVGLKIQGVSVNNLFSERVTKPTPENPVCRSATPMTSTTPQAVSIPNSVPLQNVDPETAKSILGQLVQVLQQAGQLPEDEAFQHLVQMSASQHVNVTVKTGSSKTKKTKHASSKRMQQVVQSPINKSRKSKSQAAIENAQELDSAQVRRKRSRRSQVSRVGDVRMLNVLENSSSSVEVKSEINDYSFEELVSDENRDKHNLPSCKVKLTKLPVKRDARGRVVVPESLSACRTDVRKYLNVKYLKPRSKKKSGETASVSKSVFVSGKSSAFSDSIKVHLLPDMNEARDHAVRTMYMGPTEDVLQWLTVVWWRNSHFFCQCVFCPLLAESPKTIVRHLREDHPELSFALNKKELLGKSFLFINCRHCDFVTVDPVILWIHLELHHGISGILDGGLHPDIDFSVKLELNEISGNEVISSPSSYVCFDCFRVSTNSKALALHVLQEHSDTLNYNGCFVKLMMIQKPNDRANVTYNQAISDAELASCRWDVFMCMLCDLCVKCSYTVLSHTLSSHQNRHVLFTCPECSYNTVSDDSMIVHLTDVHNMASRLVCSATVVGKTDGRFVEIPIEHNRKTSLNVPPSSDKTSLAEGEATVNSSAVNGTPKKKRKTVKSKTRMVKHNGVPAARSVKPKKVLIVQDDNGSILNSKETRCSRKRKAELNEVDVVGEDSNHDSFAAMDADKKVKEEMTSPDFDNESDCVVEDVDFKITLADEANSDSDDQGTTTNARRVRGDRRKSQSTNDISTRELLHESTAMNADVSEPIS